MIEKLPVGQVLNQQSAIKNQKSTIAVFIPPAS
jgi:hypothetical protein